MEIHTSGCKHAMRTPVADRENLTFSPQPDTTQIVDELVAEDIHPIDLRHQDHYIGRLYLKGITLYVDKCRRLVFH